MSKLPKWQPLKRCDVKPATPAHVAEMMRIYNLDAEAARARLEAYAADNEYWRNDLYQVQVRRYQDYTHINIRRLDGGPILRDWRHFQQIKNELLGPECEAVELYPAESRKWDESNKYHLFGLTDGSRFPLGFEDRRVGYEGSAIKDRGMRQRGKTMEYPE